MRQQFKTLKQALIMLLLVVVAIRIVLWAITPFIPYIIGILVVVSVLGILIYRTTRL